MIDYNKAKKELDLSDQMSSYFTALRKSLKWYRKVCFELLFGTCVVNAWVICNAQRDTNICMLKFRKCLVRAFAGKVDAEPDEKSPKRKADTCVGCYQKLRETLDCRNADKKTRKVISYCDDCDGQPGYCLQCFNDKHKL